MKSETTPGSAAQFCSGKKHFNTIAPYAHAMQWKFAYSSLRCNLQHQKKGKMEVFIQAQIITPYCKIPLKTLTLTY